MRWKIQWMEVIRYTFHLLLVVQCWLKNERRMDRDVLNLFQVNYQLKKKLIKSTLIMYGSFTTKTGSSTCNFRLYKLIILIMYKTDNQINFYLSLSKLFSLKVELLSFTSFLVKDMFAGVFFSLYIF